jgi:predicted TIM-barrel fold metal-dependent hydrolase
MIIDAHSHGVHPSYFDQLRTMGGQWGRKVAERELEHVRSTPQYTNVTVRVEQLDRYGIDMQMVTPSVPLDVNVFPGDVTTQLSLARSLNDGMAKLMDESKGKLVAAGSIPIMHFEKIGWQEMERAIKILGLKAINLPSNINGKPLDLAEFEPFWAHAEQMGVAVYIHPWPQPGRPYEADFDLPHVFGWPFETTITLARLVFSGIMERHPNLKIVSHHLGGGMIPFFMGRIMESNDPTGTGESMGPSMPRSLFDYFSRFYYDSAVGGSAAAIKCACEVFGPDQIVFATDGPHGPGKGETRLASYPGLIRSLGLSQTATEKILAGNARKLLKLG